MNNFCKTHNFTFLLLTLAILVFSGCASKKERAEFPYSLDGLTSVASESSGQNIPAPKFNKNEADPMVEPGFLFEMSNLEDRTLNGLFRVDFDGTLKLPYNVKINTEKLRASDVKSRMASAYQKFFQTQSAFSVNLAKREYLVEVRGLVEKPGRLVMAANESLESLIRRAGGLKIDRDRKEYEPRYLRVEKKDKTEFALPLADYFKSGSLSGNFVIDGGDKLVFQVDAPTNPATAQALNTIQLMGEIVRPGDISYKPGADIYYYLKLAGGPTAAASLTDIRIVRGQSNNRVIAELDSLEEGRQPLLLPGDLIIVASDKATKFERKVSTGAGLASILSAILLIFIVF